MALVSDFYGIKVKIYHNDHFPPHFHAYYNGNEVLIEIRTLTIYKGSLPSKQLKQVLDWAKQNQEQLFECWELAYDHKTVPKIPPLRY
jgi:hypothetical protein